GEGVEQRLQVVFVVGHGVLQLRGGVAGQAVGFPVEDVPAAVVQVGEVDQAGHQAFQPAAQAEALTAGEQAVAVQQGQQRVDAGGGEGELEFDLRAAVRVGHGREGG